MAIQLMCEPRNTMDNSNGAVTVTEAELSFSSCRDDVRYKGIRHRKWGKWGAEIRLCGSRTKIWLGSYDTPQQAAMAYDAALFCLRGPNSRFNFPESRNRISSSFSSSSLWSFACLSTADDIKNFSKNYALQQQQARAVAQAESPASSSLIHGCHKISVSNNYEEEVAAAATAGAAAFPELWKIQKNVVHLGCELQLANFMQQHLHNNDTKEDDDQKEI